MKVVGRYDTALQMFVEEPRDPDRNRLEFLRWLVQEGKLGEREQWAASGEYAISVAGAGETDDLNLASFMKRGREGAASFSVDLRGRGIDGVQPGNWGEGSQFMRRR